MTRGPGPPRPRLPSPAFGGESCTSSLHWKGHENIRDRVARFFCVQSAEETRLLVPKSLLITLFCVHYVLKKS